MDPVPPVPALKLNEFRINDAGDIQRMPTLPIALPIDRSPEIQLWQNARLPDLDTVASQETEPRARICERLLRRFAVRDLHNPTGTGFNDKFLPPKLVEHILNTDAVLEIIKELVKKGQLSTEVGGIRKLEEEASKYWKGRICGEGGTPGFRRLLGILLLQKQEELVDTFIRRDLTDNRFPVEESAVKLAQSSRWGDTDVDSFTSYQMKFVVPFLGLNPDTRDVPHFELGGNGFKPWAETKPFIEQMLDHPLQDDTSSGVDTSYQGGYGGFGEVSQIIIHPWQHDYHKILEDVCAIRS
jgi:hypothetical protein